MISAVFSSALYYVQDNILLTGEGGGGKEAQKYR